MLAVLEGSRQRLGVPFLLLLLLRLLLMLIHLVLTSKRLLLLLLAIVVRLRRRQTSRLDRVQRVRRLVVVLHRVNRILQRRD